MAPILNQRPPIKRAPPKPGLTFDVGWVGFTNDARDPITGMIDYFTGSDADGFPVVSHALIVESVTTCIEAVMEGGVVRSDLGKYFNDPNMSIYFRRPAFLTRKVALGIVEAAVRKLGCGYDRGLIVSELMYHSALGQFLNKVFHQWPNRFVASILNDTTDYICSELVAYALSCQPQYALQGILADPLDTIDPEDIFKDLKIFDPFINDCSNYKIR